MKHIKKFEAKSHRKVKQIEVNKLDILKKEWEDFEQNHSAWDFSYFWDKLSSYNSNYEGRYQIERDIDFVINMEYYNGSYDDYKETNKNLLSDIEWRKRNGIIRVTVNTGGYSGGSCYDEVDDEGAVEYDTGRSVSHDDLKPFLIHVLHGTLGPNNRFRNVENLVDELFNNDKFLGIIVEGSYTNYEYYGNSDDYSYIEISLWNLYKFLSKKDAL